MVSLIKLFCGYKICHRFPCNSFAFWLFFIRLLALKLLVQPTLNLFLRLNFKGCFQYGPILKNMNEINFQSIVKERFSKKILRMELNWKCLLIWFRLPFLPLPSLKSKKVFSRGFFLKILALCMLNNQEQFIVARVL